MSDEPEKRAECESCGYETTLGEYDACNSTWARRNESPKIWLCGICAGTPSGNATLWPDQSEHSTRQILKTIAYTGNMILDEIRKGKQQ